MGRMFVESSSAAISFPTVSKDYVEAMAKQLVELS
jgi:hypothetical protein